MRLPSTPLTPWRWGAQIYNISGDRFVTFDGIAKACAQAAGAPEPELVHFNPKSVDLGKAKAFPLRDQHFFASVDKVRFFAAGAASELWTLNMHLPSHGVSAHCRVKSVVHK